MTFKGHNLQYLTVLNWLRTPANIIHQAIQVLAATLSLLMPVTIKTLPERVVAIRPNNKPPSIQWR